MKAVRVGAFGVAPELVDVPDPARRAGRTIVAVEAATVGHIDRTIWGGGFLRYPPLPYTPGVEAAGTVLSPDGPFPPGSRVWVRGGGLGVATDGTWAELVSAPDVALGALPDDVDAALGSAFFSPCTSAWVALHDVGQVQAGQTVIITGAAGAVGAVAVQLALELGAHVVATASNAQRARRVPAGATTVVLDRDHPEVPSDLAGDVLIDTVGGAMLAALLEAVRPGGRAVLVGYLGGHDLLLDLPVFIQRDVQLLPLNMIRREDAGRAAAPELLARLGDGRLSLDVTSFPLDEAAAALDWLASGSQHGRAVLVPGATSPPADTRVVDEPLVVGTVTSVMGTAHGDDVR